MKTKTCFWALTLAVTAICLIGGPAWAGIANTKHNLGSTGSGTYNTTDTAAICVFCHTPHGADTSAPVPLWNRKLPSGASFTTYASMGTSTLDSANGLTGSVSLACLSCHDGTQAMDVMINAPGSGGYNAAGADALYTWAGGIDTIPVGITRIGTDLKDDHPISIQYAGGGYDATQTLGTSAAGTTCTNCVDKDFFKPSQANLGGTQVWWVNSTGGTTAREKTDMLLYTRGIGVYTGQTQAEPFVECASCHDPHTETATFLRVANTGSAVCLACHNK